MKKDSIIRIIGLILIIVSIYLYITNFLGWLSSGGETPLGENMVNNEIVIIKNILMFKPITLAMISGALGYLMVLDSITDPLTTDKRIVIARLAKIVAYAFLIISGYEFIFNMMIWSAYIALYGNNINIDLIYTQFPYTKYSWNIVFATKLFFMILVISLGTIYYVTRWERKQ